MPRNLVYILVISLFLVSCIKDFTANPEAPDKWSPSWSVPVGTVTIPFDESIFEGFIPDIPTKKNISIPIQYEDYPVFNFDQEEFSLEGTMAFDFSGLTDDFSQIKLILFKLKTENGFPTSVTTVLDIKDENLNTLFSLVEGADSLFKTPDQSQFNDNNEVISPGIATPEIKITDSRMQQLEQAKYLDFKLAIATQRIIDGIISLDTVTFLRDYSIGIEVGLRVDLDVDLSN